MKWEYNFYQLFKQILRYYFLSSSSAIAPIICKIFLLEEISWILGNRWKCHNDMKHGFILHEWIEVKNPIVGFSLNFLQLNLMQRNQHSGVMFAATFLHIYDFIFSLLHIDILSDILSHSLPSSLSYKRVLSAFIEEAKVIYSYLTTTVQIYQRSQLRLLFRFFFCRTFF